MKMQAVFSLLHLSCTALIYLRRSLSFLSPAHSVVLPSSLFTEWDPSLLCLVCPCESALPNLTTSRDGETGGPPVVGLQLPSALTAGRAGWELESSDTWRTTGISTPDLAEDAFSSGSSFWWWRFSTQSSYWNCSPGLNPCSQIAPCHQQRRNCFLQC